MVLSNSIVDYRQVVKLIIFIIVESFEFVWYIYGSYEFYIDTKCPPASKNDYFYYNIMLFATLLGVFHIFNYIVVATSMAMELLIKIQSGLTAMSFRVLMLRHVCKIKFRTNFFNAET